MAYALDSIQVALDVEGFRWTSLWIILASICFIYSVSWVGHPPGPPPLLLPQRATALRSRIAEARRYKAEKAARSALALRYQQQRESWRHTPYFPFQKLPQEIQYVILGHSLHSYHSLALVSRRIHLYTLKACVPRMAVKLMTQKQISSFFNTLQSNPAAASLVHTLWVSPLRSEDERHARAILRACTNVRVLACNARSLVAAVARHTRFKHALCRDLTLLLSPPSWELALCTPSGALFLQKLARLRVMDERMVPRTLRLPRLTHLSYMERAPGDPGAVCRPWALGHREGFPELQQVVLTRRGAAGTPAEKVGPNTVAVYFSFQLTEIEIWEGKDIWEQAAQLTRLPDSKRRVSGGRSDS